MHFPSQSSHSQTNCQVFHFRVSHRRKLCWLPSLERSSEPSVMKEDGDMEHCYEVESFPFGFFSTHAQTSHYSAELLSICGQLYPSRIARLLHVLCRSLAVSQTRRNLFLYFPCSFAGACPFPLCTGLIWPDRVGVTLHKP